MIFHIYLVCFLVHSIESIVASLGDPVEVVHVIRLIVTPAPGQEDELAVAVDVVVELDCVLVCGQELSQVLGLDLREGLSAHVGVCAGIVRAAPGSPLISEVPVGVSSKAIVPVWAPCLPPQPVVSLSEEVSIRINNGQDVPFMKKLSEH